MKARVKATDKIVEVKSRSFNSVTGGYILKYVDQDTGVTYFEEELFFPKDSADDPDYWTRLEHQYAGMAMQGLLSCSQWEVTPRSKLSLQEATASAAYDFAHALVEKYKKEERK